jgi:lysophospholipase L1-like esterase
MALSVAVLLVATALCLVGAELAWRWLKGVPLGSRDNLIQQALDLVRANTGVMVHDPVLGWRLKDDVLVVQGGFTTGRLGVRMNQTEIRPLRRGGILAVGDSFTAGSGVRDEEAWPARLELLVGEPVTNGAAGAYGVDQMVLRAEQLLPEIEPKTLIVGILGQDSLRNNFSVYGGGYKPYFVVEAGKAVLKGVPVPLVDAAPLELDPVRGILGHSYMVDAGIKALGLQQWWIDNHLRYKKVHADRIGVDISCLLMDRLGQLKQARGLRVIVLMMYGAAEIEAKPAPWFGPPVVACAKQRGLEAIDSYDAVRAVLERDRRAFVELWLDEGGQLGHLSPKGNQFMADLLARTFFAR